jgi:transcriptional regulatory protein LevR
MSNFPEMDYKPITTEELIELAPHETSLDFLRKIYRSVKQPMSRRMRAAIEAMPHEHPRLGAVAIGCMNGQDFASMLERAIERSGKKPQVKQIECSAVDITQRQSEKQ